MTNSNNITSKYDDERLRAAEQSQIVYLQNQIDELRRQIKDQTNKYHWALEQVRKVEGSVAQIDGILDRHRQEVAQALDGYRRDIAALRKEAAAALMKIDEAQKPLREMQTQIHQLGEARKQDRDQVVGWFLRIEELEERTRDWRAQINAVEERYRGLAGRIDGLYAVDESVRVEIRKVNEDLQIEKQSLRRQVVEGQQVVTEIHTVLDEHLSRILRLDEIRQRIDSFIDEMPGQITALDVRLVDIVADMKRIERVATERTLMNQERLEDLRHQQEERLIVLQEVDDVHQRQFTSWLERVDEMVRELEQRLTRVAARIEVVQREHDAQLSVLERRDVELVNVLATTLHDRAERIKAEQIERGIGDDGHKA